MQSLLCHSLRASKIPISGLKFIHNVAYSTRKSAYPACFGSWTSNLFRDEPKIIQQQSRNTGFFAKVPASSLWKSTASVSNAGMRRGRGRKINASIVKNLNRGQVLGCGEVAMQWPGLNAPVFRGSDMVEQRRLPDDEDRLAKMIAKRSFKAVKKRKLHRLDRGFTSSKIDGTRIPAELQRRGDETPRPVLDGFETVVLNSRPVSRMVGKLGRATKWSVLVAVGNKNGSIGIGRARKVLRLDAVLAARAAAQRKLLYIERHNNHTVLHDFFSRFGRSKIEVRKRPEGFGLRCQRVLRVMCQVAGIKDIYCKFHGNRTVDQNVKAFLLGLINQKTHQTIADEVGLNIVEIDPARYNFPKVIASPAKCSEQKTFAHESMCNFSHYTMNNQIVFHKKKVGAFYTKTAGWQNFLLKQEKRRNQDEVRRRLKIKYGQVQSFYTEKYPEAAQCRKPARRKAAA